MDIPSWFFLIISLDFGPILLWALLDQNLPRPQYLVICSKIIPFYCVNQAFYLTSFNKRDSQNEHQNYKLNRRFRLIPSERSLTKIKIVFWTKLTLLCVWIYEKITTCLN